MKKAQVFLGIFALVLELWITTTLIQADGQSLIGAGWDFYSGCCTGATEYACDDGPPGTQPYCDPGEETWACDPSGQYYNFYCTPLGYDNCDNGSYNCPGEETGCYNGQAWYW